MKASNFTLIHFTSYTSKAHIYIALSNVLASKSNENVPTAGHHLNALLQHKHVGSLYTICTWDWGTELRQLWHVLPPLGVATENRRAFQRDTFFDVIEKAVTLPGGNDV